MTEWWHILLFFIGLAIFVQGLSNLTASVGEALQKRNRRRIDMLRTKQGKMPIRWRDYDDPLIDT